MKTLDPSIYPWIDAAKQAVKREKSSFATTSAQLKKQATKPLMMPLTLSI
ncbi:hypothetical protein [Gilliamella sp. GillExp13]|nr:hypothetical protein [Gilliamella apicola]